MLNVEYRLAPEHKVPAQMDDGLCVVRWLKQNSLTLGTVNVRINVDLLVYTCTVFKIF